MCIKSPSESGQPCGFVPCERYAILEAKLGHTKFLQERIRKRYEILRKKCLKLRQERDALQLGYKAAESSRRLAIVELNSFMDRINATLHPDDNAPSAPSGCDLVTYVKELREERCYFRNAIYHLAALLGREITDDYTASCLLEDIIKERNMAARTIEKADALAKTLEDESLSQFALKDAKAYQEARHG